MQKILFSLLAVFFLFNIPSTQAAEYKPYWKFYHNSSNVWYLFYDANSVKKELTKNDEIIWSAKTKIIGSLLDTSQTIYLNETTMTTWSLDGLSKHYSPQKIQDTTPASSLLALLQQNDHLNNDYIIELKKYYKIPY